MSGPALTLRNLQGGHFREPCVYIGDHQGETAEPEEQVGTAEDEWSDTGVRSFHS